MMCGIFGFVSRSEQSVELLHTLADANKVRGNLGFGGCFQSNGVLSTFRDPRPYARSGVPFERTTLALGHIRAPTGGQSDRLETVHPFETDDLLLAHNGILLNHADFAQWRVRDSAEFVDTQIIIGGIQTHLDQGVSLYEAVTQTISQLDGQQACWLWHKPTQTLLLWRVMSPIFVTANADLLQFSSIRHADDARKLSQGVVYRVDVTSLQLDEVARFAYQTPYGNV